MNATRAIAAERGRLRGAQRSLFTTPVHPAGMARLFRAPGSYVQTPGAIDDLPAHLGAVDGTRALLVGGSTALSAVEDRLVDGLTGGGLEVAGVERGVDACTEPVVDRGAELVATNGADVVVGVGGGSAVDAAKAVAARADAEFVSVPTIASTDAPASGLAVVYDGDGGVHDLVLRERNPELVVVDTEPIAEAPARFLRHGIGDAIATRFEAEAVEDSGGFTLYGGTTTRTGLAAARACYRELREHGQPAIEAAGRDEVSPALERVVEAVLLLSAVGFENGGLAAAHALETACRNAGTTAPHGVVVGFCTLAQLVLEDHECRPEVEGVLSDLGLAVSLADLGLADRVDRIADAACENPLVANEPVEVTPAAVADALRTADRLLGA